MGVSEEYEAEVRGDHTLDSVEDSNHIAGQSHANWSKQVKVT